MKFVRKLSSSSSAVSVAVPASSSFVATDLKKVVFEVGVMGRVENTDVIITRDIGETSGFTAVFNFHDESALQHDSFDHEKDSTPMRMGPKGLFLHGVTTQNIILWVLYGLWIIVSLLR